jgi:hypothetical protein
MGAGSAAPPKSFRDLAASLGDKDRADYGKCIGPSARKGRGPQDDSSVGNGGLGFCGRCARLISGVYMVLGSTRLGSLLSEEAAGKSRRASERQTSGAKARRDFNDWAAQVNSCPSRFVAGRVGCEAGKINNRLLTGPSAPFGMTSVKSGAN